MFLPLLILWLYLNSHARLWICFHVWIYLEKNISRSGVIQGHFGLLPTVFMLFKWTPRKSYVKISTWPGYFMSATFNSWNITQQRKGDEMHSNGVKPLHNHWTLSLSLCLYLSPPLSENVVYKLHNFTIQWHFFKSVNMTHCIIYNATKHLKNLILLRLACSTCKCLSQLKDEK